MYEEDAYNSGIDIKGALSGYLPGDPPLLSELGIDFSSIKKDSMLIFSIMKWKTRDAEFENVSSDLVGPACFLFLFALALLLNGRIHFGYLYFLSLTSSLSIYVLLKLMTVLDIDFLKVISILGYSFIPTLLFAFVNMLLPVSRKTKMVVGMAFALWSTHISSTVITNHFKLPHRQLLIAYPILMIYICFVITAMV
jgi:protein YIPF5/7